MAHETHHATSHSTEKSSKSSMSASFWFVLILVGLFIAAVNFVNVMSNEHEEGEGATTEHMHEAVAPEAHGEAHAAEAATATTADTAHTGGAAADTTAHAEHH